MVELATSEFRPDRNSHAREIDALLAQSRREDGRAYLSGETRQWLSALKSQLPKRFWVHRDDASRRAAELLGAGGFVRHNHIFLCDVSAQHLDSVLQPTA